MNMIAKAFVSVGITATTVLVVALPASAGGSRSGSQYCQTGYTPYVTASTSGRVYVTPPGGFQESYYSASAGVPVSHGLIRDVRQPRFRGATVLLIALVLPGCGVATSAATNSSATMTVSAAASTNPVALPTVPRWSAAFSREIVSRVVDCLARSGHPVTLVPGGDGFRRPPGADEVAYRAAEDRCFDAQGPLPGPTDFTDAELRQLFAAYMSSSQCLKKAGFTVDPPPSFESWAAAYRMGRQQWSPYDVAYRTHDPVELDRTCPRP